MRLVLDTNVLVSGLLSATGPPGRILDLILRGGAHVVFDDRILAEYREVLRRPRFGLHPGEAAVILDWLAAEGELVTAPPLARLR